MNYDPELEALLSQTWSNDACRGYVIAAMERCGFKPSDIEQVMVELYEVHIRPKASTFAVLAFAMFQNIL